MYTPEEAGYDGEKYLDNSVLSADGLLPTYNAGLLSKRDESVCHVVKYKKQLIDTL
jgi:hypothetical protein